MPVNYYLKIKKKLNWLIGLNIEKLTKRTYLN